MKELSVPMSARKLTSAKGKKRTTVVNFQFHIRVVVPLTHSLSSRAVSEIINHWIDTGEEIPGVSITSIDWSIDESYATGGRSRREGTYDSLYDAEKHRKRFFQRFRYGIKAHPVSHMGKIEA